MTQNYDIDTYQTALVNSFKQLDQKALDRFGVWCCHALTMYPRVFDFSDRLVTGIPGLREKILLNLQNIWDFKPYDPEFLKRLVDADSIDWDYDDIDDRDDAAAVGLEYLLGAVYLLGQWKATNDIADLTGCAEQLVNWVDYLEQFELIAVDLSAAPFQVEAAAQIQFLEDLKNNTVTSTDMFKYHEWLAKNFK